MPGFERNARRLYTVHVSHTAYSFSAYDTVFKQNVAIVITLLQHISLDSPRIGPTAKNVMTKVNFDSMMVAATF